MKHIPGGRTRNEKATKIKRTDYGDDYSWHVFSPLIIPKQGNVVTHNLIRGHSGNNNENQNFVDEKIKMSLFICIEMIFEHRISINLIDSKMNVCVWMRIDAFGILLRHR